MPLSSFDLANHEYRNAIAPALTTLGILKNHRDKLSPAEIEKHIKIIETSISNVAVLVDRKSRVSN